MQGSGETRRPRSNDPKPDVSQQTQAVKPKDQTAKSGKDSVWDLLSKKHPKLAVALSVAVLFTAALLMFIVLVVSGEAIWEWGTQTWYHTIALVLIIGFILMIFLGILMFLSENVSDTTRTFLETPHEKLVKEERQSIEDAEGEILKNFDERISDMLSSSDKDEMQELLDLRSVFLLCMFRRKQLGLYYTLNHGQTKLSFLCSLVAMFAGFGIIAIGIASSFGFFEVVFPDTTPTDMDNVVIAGGVLAELISALFLWIYLASAKQLMFFYRNQAFAHSVMTSFQIANSMTDATAKNAAKREIIKNYLGYSFLEPSIELPKSGKKQAP